MKPRFNSLVTMPNVTSGGNQETLNHLAFPTVKHGGGSVMLVFQQQELGDYSGSQER
uniref:Uncharacterized protein n=1 Tax=Anguilla anguilla TaxID=7936 RepID=A0A0E9R3Z4_ANGAN